MLSSTTITDDMLLPQIVTATIEAIINKALSLNNTSTSLASLNQKTLTLALEELPFLLCITVTKNVNQSVINNRADSGTELSVVVRSQCEESDCTINTSISTLTKLKAKQSLTQLIKQDELDVSGDIKVAQQFATIAQSLDIDWQSELAKHLGDVPTHKLLNLGNKITASVSKKAKQVEADIGEYLVHEKRLVVTNSQISAYNQQTNDIAEQVERLANRIDQLAQKVSVKVNDN